MNKKPLKKTVYSILFVLLIIFNLYNIFRILPLHGSVSELKLLSEASAVNYTDKFYNIKDKAIFVANKNESLYQYFNFKGKFLWGAKIPNTKNIEGVAYSLDTENVYIWSERTESVFVFDESGFACENKHPDIKDADSFYKTYIIKPENAGIMMSGSVNKVKMNGNIEIPNEQTCLKLDAPFNLYTTELSVILIVVCSVCCLILKKKLDKE